MNQPEAVPLWSLVEIGGSLLMVVQNALQNNPTLDCGLMTWQGRKVYLGFDLSLGLSTIKRHIQAG